MKKLLFTLAAAASFAALAADPTPRTGDIDVLGFENFDFTNPLTTNVVVGVGDDGLAGTTKWVGSVDDSSIVKTYGGDNAATGNGLTYPAPFEDEGGNYLALDTNGSELQRPIPAANQAIGADGTYIDTLVQFTVTEDEAPTIEPGSDIKLAIWLGVTNVNDEVTTNLYVAGGFYDIEGGDTLVSSAKSYKLDTTCEPNTWYRLTVKAYRTIGNAAAGEDTLLPAFTILINGTEVTIVNPNTEHVYSQAALEYLCPSEGEDPQGADYLDETELRLLKAGKIIPSLDSMFRAGTITSVGFQGTGAIDDLVVTTENPFYVSPIDFTLTWGEGVDAVSYVLSTDLATTNSLTSGTAVQFAPGDGTATIELIPTFTTGYEFDKVTMGETELGLTFAIPGVTTNATLLAKAAAAEYPTYIDTSDATIKAKYDAWKAGVGFDDSSASSHLNQFLLNVDEATTVGDAALEITEIKQNATAGWDITIGCAVSGASLTGTVGETIVCNGYLAVSYTDDLTGTWTTENIAITAVDATAGTVTVNVNKSGAKFMKVSLTAAPQPAAQE